MPKPLLLPITCSLVAAALVSQAQATVLIFKNSAGAGFPEDEDVPGAYGDNVTGSVTGDFSYGSEGDFTPNIVIDYNQPSDIKTYNGSFGPYGDLSSIIYSYAASYSLTFTADPGFEVEVASFKIAGYGGEEVLPRVTISSGALQYTQTNLIAPGSGHLLVDFSGSPLAARGQTVTLTLTLNSNEGATNSNGELGVSEIQFSQVPEPSAALMVVSGLALLGLVRRRRS